MTSSFVSRWFAAVLLMFTALVTAHAQQPADPEADPPGRVARLADFSGQVWLYSPDSGEWVGAVRNQPVAAGDRIATEADAHAELQLGSTTLRLDSSTEVEVATLDDERLALRLESGSLIARVADLANAGALEVETNDGRFVVQRNGSYRIDHTGNSSHLTVYNGLARFEGQNSALPVTPGQRAEFWIDSGGVAQYALTGPASDAFSAWNSERDRRIVGSTTARYVSPEMTGAEELDRYGRWEQSPEYGALWIPTAVAADWAPYRAGHWAWVRPWGWTWIDDAPWGFAPFHYGRWVYARNTWCWTPGTRVVRPVYAPALVAWMGSPRGGVSITVGGGPAVGWFPLAPREVYVPSYRVSPRYARNVNGPSVGNVTIINKVFANPQARREFDNRRWPGAITVVPAAVMTSRQPVGPADAQWRRGPQSRELIAATQPGRGVALIAPPVAAPPVRSVDPRAVRPPPGFAERPAGPRPGFGPGQQERDRDNRGRDVARPESPRPMPPVGVRPQGPILPAAPAVNPSPGVAAPAPGVSPPPAVAPAPPRERPPLPGNDDRRRPGGDRGGDRNDRGGAPPVIAPNPAPPLTRPGPAVMRPEQPQVQTAPPAAAPPPQTAPMMRTQPVRRGEDRRDAPPPRAPEAAPPAAAVERPQMRAQPQPRFERPAPPQPVAPPAAVAPPPRPAAVAPAAPPARPAEAARPAPEQRRPESRDPREQQR